MSGKVPPSSRAGKGVRDPHGDVARAAKLYETFTGHDAEEIGHLRLKMPQAAAVIGQCDFIGYTTVRDGVREAYIHKFRAADRPLLAVTPDGQQLLLLGGNYDFTERGIVDATDPELGRSKRR